MLTPLKCWVRPSSRAYHEAEQGAVAVDVEAVLAVPGVRQDLQHPVQIVHRAPHLHMRPTQQFAELLNLTQERTGCRPPQLHPVSARIRSTRSESFTAPHICMEGSASKHGARNRLFVQMYVRRPA